MRSIFFQNISWLFPVFLRRLVAQGTGVLCLLGGFFIGASLISYSSSDPSWNTAVDAIPQNWGGAMGALWGDLLKQLMGHLSFIIGAFLLFLSYILICRRGLSYLFYEDFLVS